MDKGSGFCFAHDHKFMYFCFYLSIFSRLVSDVSLTARATVKFTYILSFVYRSQLIFDDNDKEELAYQKCLPLAIVQNQFEEDVVILKCFLLDMHNTAFLIKVLKITHSTKIFSFPHLCLLIVNTPYFTSSSFIYCYKCIMNSSKNLYLYCLI